MFHWQNHWLQSNDMKSCIKEIELSWIYINDVLCWRKPGDHRDCFQMPPSLTFPWHVTSMPEHFPFVDIRRQTLSHYSNPMHFFHGIRKHCNICLQRFLGKKCCINLIPNWQDKNYGPLTRAWFHRYWNFEEIVSKILRFIK